MDNFTIAVLLGAAGVVLGFGLMFLFDKKVEIPESAPPAGPATPAGPKIGRTPKPGR